MLKVRVTILLLVMFWIGNSFAQSDPFQPPTVLYSDTSECLGVAIGDFNNDGWDDIFIARGDSRDGNPLTNLLFKNNLGTLVQVTGVAPVTENQISVGCSWGDYNNDGYIDLYIAEAKEGAMPYDPIPPNNLYLNDGPDEFTFTKVTSAGPIVTDEIDSRVVAWGDRNNDGLLDMFIDNGKVVFGSNGKEQNSFYTNIDGSTFNRDSVNDVGLIVSDSIQYKTFGSGFGWCDYNNDGWMDIFNCSGGGATNRLWKNKDGNGFEETLASFFQDTTGGIHYSSVGCSWGDFNNDWRMDLFVTNAIDSPAGNNFLYVNYSTASKDSFLFLKENAGDVYNDYYYSQGSVWFDVDNDGDLDLYTTSLGHETDDLSRLYINSGYPDYELSALTSVVEQLDPGDGTTRGNGRAVATIDVNHDGALDLVVTRVGEPLLYMNKGTTNGYLNVKVTGRDGYTNKLGIGVKVKIVAHIPEQGEQWTRQMREIAGITGGLAQSSQIAHFGVGTASTIDTVYVEWPVSGNVDVFTDVSPNQTIQVNESEPAALATTGAVVNHYALGQNYPNPFNPSTHIPFVLPKAEKVTIELFNINGQKIGTIYSGVRPAGKSVIRYHPGNLASGVYFYAIKAGKFHQVRKMMFIK